MSIPSVGDTWAGEVFANSVFPIEVAVLALSKELFAGSLETLIRKEVKGKGYLNLVLVLPPNLALTLPQVLEYSHMELP